MREDLLCYALGELDEHASRLIEAELAKCPQLREELAELQRCLADLDADEQQSQSHCPTGLADRTAQQILCGQPPSGGCGGPAREPAAAKSASAAKSKAPSPRDPGGYASRGISGFVARTPISLVDSMVAVGVMMVMAALVLPAVNSSRSVSHRLACQHNMRELGQLLVMFSQDNNSYYPAIGPDDNAGSFTMQLTGANFVDRSALEQMVTCPGGLAAAASRDASTLPAFIPSVQQMQTATPVQLAQWRHQMSGHMAYRIGFVNNGRYYPVRNSKHCQLAVLADTPTMTPEGFHSTNHDGGQNVLWQDGSVSFEPCTLVSCTKDHIYLNNEGLPSAGLGWCDSVLAPSHATPGVARDTQPAPSFLRIRFNFVPARQLPVILDNSMLSAE